MVTTYSTGDASSRYTNVLIYGMAGSGKTPLAATAPRPLIVASEPGLKSLAAHNIPYVMGRNRREALDVLAWLKSSTEARKYDTIFFDSISMLSENILMEAKQKSSDPRKYSPQTTGETMEVVLGYLALQNKNIVMTCKAVELRDNLTGATTAEPFATVPKLGPALPYHFDEVLFLSRHRNDAGQDYSALRCRYDPYCTATRDRTGKLDLWERPDLTYIFNKLNGA